jgi:hypothetical protein
MPPSCPGIAEHKFRYCTWLLLSTGATCRHQYCISFASFADTDGISGNARIAGLNKDLNLTGLQYNTAVTLFFPPYCLFEVPSNIVLKIIRPSVWLSILLFCWGIGLAFLLTI